MNNYGDTIVYSSNDCQKSHKFYFHVGPIFYDAFINVPYKKNGFSNHEDYQSISYFNPKTSNYKASFNFGFYSVNGSNKTAKFIYGLNYLFLNSEYQVNKTYNHGGGPGATQYIDELYALRYKSSIHYLNLPIGLRITIKNKFHLDNLISINKVVSGNNKISGIHYTHKYSFYPTYNEQNTTEDINKNENIDLIGTVSFSPKLSYDFNVMNVKSGAYVGFNMAYGIRLYYFSMGLVYGLN